MMFPFPPDEPEDPDPATLYGSSSLDPDPNGRIDAGAGPDCVR